MHVARPERSKRILHRRERRAHCRLRAQNIRSERNLHKSTSRGGSEFRVGPSALGADGDGHASDIVVAPHRRNRLKHFAQRPRACPLGEQ